MGMPPWLTIGRKHFVPMLRWPESAAVLTHGLGASFLDQFAYWIALIYVGLSVQMKVAFVIPNHWIGAALD